MTTEDGTQGGSRNVVRKFTLHTVQNTQNQKSVLIPRWKSEIKNSTNKSSLNPVCEYERIVCSRCELLSLRWSLNELVSFQRQTQHGHLSKFPDTHVTPIDRHCNSALYISIRQGIWSSVAEFLATCACLVVRLSIQLPRKVLLTGSCPLTARQTFTRTFVVFCVLSYEDEGLTRQTPAASCEAVSTW